MAKQWTCARCSTKNDEGTLTCSNCRMIRGAFVVPGTFNAYPDASSPAAADPAAAAAGEPGPATPSYWSAAGSASPGGEVPAPTPFWRRIPIGLVIFGLLLAAGAIGGIITNAGRSDTGEIVNDGDMMATDLRVGDCFDLKDPTAEEISDVTARPCTDPHQYELIWTGSMAEGAYPPKSAFDAFMESNCFNAFDAYVGTAFEDSELDIYWLYPVEDGWNNGDRSVQCAAYHPTNSGLTSSLRASAQ